MVSRARQIISRVPTDIVCDGEGRLILNAALGGGIDLPSLEGTTFTAISGFELSDGETVIIAQYSNTVGYGTVSWGSADLPLWTWQVTANGVDGDPVLVTEPAIIPVVTGESIVLSATFFAPAPTADVLTVEDVTYTV